MKLKNISRTFQEQILKNLLIQGFCKNHLQFKNNSTNSRNSRTTGHPDQVLSFVCWLY